MKSRFSRKQITEAIARWSRVLRRMDEAGEEIFDSNYAERALAQTGFVRGDTHRSLFHAMTYLYATGADEDVTLLADGECALIKADADDNGLYFKVEHVEGLGGGISVANAIDAAKRSAAKGGVRLDASPNRW